MKNVQEKVWMTVAKWDNQKVELPVDEACISMEEGGNMLIGVQTLGIL